MMNYWDILTAIFAWAAIIVGVLFWIAIPCIMGFMLIDIVLGGTLSEKLRKKRAKNRETTSQRKHRP
jgi:hypothetical protein